MLRLQTDIRKCRQYFCLDQGVLFFKAYLYLIRYLNVPENFVFHWITFSSSSNGHSFIFGNAAAAAGVLMREEANSRIKGLFP